MKEEGLETLSEDRECSGNVKQTFNRQQLDRRTLHCLG